MAYSSKDVEILIRDLQRVKDALEGLLVGVNVSRVPTSRDALDSIMALYGQLYRMPDQPIEAADVVESVVTQDHRDALSIEFESVFAARVVEVRRRRNDIPDFDGPALGFKMVSLYDFVTTALDAFDTRPVDVALWYAKFCFLEYSGEEMLRIALLLHVAANPTE